MDLTRIILKAKSSLLKVSIEKYIFSVNAFAYDNNLSIDWDKEDGEIWGRLLKQNKLQAIFNSKIPLILVDNSLYDQALKFFYNDIIVFQVSSWDEKLYSIDLSKISSFLTWNSSITTKKLSINDIWYSTV